jgi:hypothetical protein
MLSLFNASTESDGMDAMPEKGPVGRLPRTAAQGSMNANTWRSEHGHLKNEG